MPAPRSCADSAPRPSPGDALDLAAPATPADLDAVRALCWEYRDFLLGLGGIDAEIVAQIYTPETYADVMARLAEDHAPPTGGICLATLAGAPVGCGMFHTLAPGTAEIKRLFVRAQARGVGAGRAIMERLIADIRAGGFARILLDTAPPLTAAQGLYESLGFSRRGPYQKLPAIADGHLVFFEMTL